ncbi:MAG: hypothetical protein AAF416_18685 [Pseudomonadota bacterium]
MTVHVPIQSLPDRLQAVFGPAAQMPPRRINDFHAAFARAFAATPEVFHWIHRDDLVAESSHIAMAHDAAGIHACFVYETSPEEIYIHGLFAGRALPSLAGRLIAMVGLADVAATGAGRIRATTRIYRDGEVNVPAAACLARLGLVPIRVFTRQILDTAQDAHLSGTHADDEGVYRSLEMAAKPDKFRARARALLGSGA